MPGLREQAEADLAFILEDDVSGFGWPITIIDPAGKSVNLIGFSNDISQLIDPDTGQAVSGRLATVALRIKSLNDNNLSLPQGITDLNKNPWIVKFQDVNLRDYTFRVRSHDPDRALGIVVCILELYKEC